MLSRLETLMPRSLDSIGAPVRIIVPSRSLRRHILKAVGDRFGAVVGVVVQTHRGLAMEVLKRADVELPAGGARVQDLLARRFAADEDVLRCDLSEFDDGYQPVVAAVRDLLDAGLGPETFEPAIEAIGTALRGREAERAVAVIRVAAKCRVAAEAMGLAHRGTLHQWAARAVIERGDAVLPSKALLIHGFAEATGLLSDFLELLVQRCGAEVIIDHPVDPVRSTQRDPGCVFTERLTDHLGGPGSGREETQSGSGKSEIDAFRAPGPEAEIREIVERIRRLINEDVVPETIGVVFRQLSPPTIAAIRRHFGRHGIPFSGEGAQAPGGALARQASALAELLTVGPQASTGSWLVASVLINNLERREVDLAMRTLGAAHLLEVAALEVEDAVGPGGLRLPVVEGVDEVEGDLKKRRRTFLKRDLERTVADAGTLVRILENRHERATVGVFFKWIREALGALGRSPSAECGESLVRAIDKLESELPGSIEVAWTELAPLVMRALEGLGAEPLGGQGGGVQVLTVMEARGRTFEHLFVPNLNRGVFPVQGADDPVFSSKARCAVAQLLPEIPLKPRDRPEERYLFAQLLSAAPKITLSWQTVDADGKELNPSVFVERLRLGGVVWWHRDGRGVGGKADTGALAQEVPDAFGPRPIESPRSLLEHGVVEGLEGRGVGFFAALGRLADIDPCHAKVVLDEIDPPEARSDLGPFLGAVGMRPAAEVWVTFVEALVGCPWKAFLERVLGIEAPPEASLSEEGLRGSIVGSVVHEVLERVVIEGGAGSRQGLDQVQAGQAVRVPRPGAATLGRIAAEVARRKTIEEGVPLLGRAVGELARVFLERARELAWSDGEALVLGVETMGRADFSWAQPGSGEETNTVIRFRADRVDRRPDGEGLVLTDYKTGLPTTSSAKLAIVRGQLLQGAVYALGGGRGSLGRYVVLKDVPKPLIEIDEGMAGGVVPPVRAVLGSWAEGVFFPRMSGPDGKLEGPSCRWCTVRSACLHGDSGVRRRMIDAFAAMDPDAPLRVLWELPATKVSASKKETG